MELTTLGAFLRTLRHGDVNRQVPGDMTRVCGDAGVLIRVSQIIVRPWFQTGFFLRVPSFALLLDLEFSADRLVIRG